MKDIDFDELDRAVSSVLTSRAAPAAQEAKIVNNAPTPRTTTPVVPAVSDTASPVTVTSPAAPTVTRPVMSRPTSPAMRRGGRFMDVVLPSSPQKPAGVPVARAPKRTLGPVSDDMKPVAVPAVPTREPQTVASTDQDLDIKSVTAAVEPVKDVAAEPFPTLDTLPADSSPRIDTTPTVEEVEAEPATVAWPDPINTVSPSTEQSSSNDEVITVGRPEDAKDELEAEAVPAAPAAPVGEQGQTPFLPDTKVEKRPLGAFAEGTGEADTITASYTSDSPVVSPQLEADLAEIELREDLTEEIVQPKAVPVVPTSTEVAEPQPTVVSQQSTSTAFGSDNATHPFDTSAYHQPLLPSKTQSKSHTWVWVLLIIGLLIVGAGLGALFFMAGF